MVEPGTTVGAADDTIVEPTPAASVPAASGKGWASYSTNKKMLIGGGAGVVIGLGIYIWRKRQANAQVGAAQVAAPPSSSSASGANNTAPQYVLPSSNQDAVQGANDAALETALGSLGTTLNTIGNEVNNPPPPIITTTNTGNPFPPSTTTIPGEGLPGYFQPAPPLVQNTTPTGNTSTGQTGTIIFNQEPLSVQQELLSKAGMGPGGQVKAIP